MAKRVEITHTATGEGVIEFGGKKFVLTRPGSPCLCPLKYFGLGAVKFRTFEIKELSIELREPWTKIALLSCGHARYETKDGDAVLLEAHMLALLLVEKYRPSPSLKISTS